MIDSSLVLGSGYLVSGPRADATLYAHDITFMRNKLAAIKGNVGK